MAIFLRPPDVLQILEGVKQLQLNLASAVGSLSTQLTDLRAHLDARLDEIEAAETTIEDELNPAIPPVLPLVYWSIIAMGIVTSINLAAGGASDGVQVQDSSTPPQVFPGSQVTWSVPIGEANASDLGVTLDADGVTFTFLAPAGSPTESVTLFATWTDPAGVQSPIVAAPLTVNITGVVSTTTFVAPMQYNEVSGS